MHPPRRERTCSRRSVVLSLAGAVWLAGVGIGVKLLWDYKTEPGAPAQPPETWPAESRIARAPGRATLVMLAHPRCPCTRASLGELAKLMARLRDRVDAFVLFLKPVEFPSDWEKTDTWRSAARIPGVRVIRDDGGLEAARFRATTSGHAVLYNAAGRLLFSGGITPSRGHEGDNAGSQRILSLLTEAASDPRDSLVFGCPLRESG